MLIVWNYLEDLFLLFIMKRTSKLLTYCGGGGEEGEWDGFQINCQGRNPDPASHHHRHHLPSSHTNHVHLILSPLKSKAE